MIGDFYFFWALLLGVAILAVVGYFLYRYTQKKHLTQRANDLVMLEVRVPKKYEREEYENLKTIAEITSIMDQLFSSLASLYQVGIKGILNGQPIISFELVAKEKEIIFFVGVPKNLQNLVQKQIHSFYPNANIEPSGDFRVFKKGLETACGIVQTSRSYIYPIKTYNELTSDSISNVTNALSKIGDDSRVALQILVRPISQGWRAQIDWAVKRIQEGKGAPLGITLWNKASYFLSEFLSGMSQDKQAEVRKTTSLQEETVKLLTQKSSKTGFVCQIRIVSLSQTKEEAKANLRNIFSSFGQFSSPDRNGFKLYETGDKKEFLTHYILRSFYGLRRMILNSEELASIYHLPSEQVDTPGIRWHMAKRASAPANIPKEGLILGKNIYRGDEVLIRLKEADRRKHLYAIGMTGTGKSVFFESLILQDIKEGRGVAVFDPHGELIEGLLNKIPKARAEDVIYFDPADTQRPMGVNLLEWKTKEQKDFLVQEAVQIFYKLFDPNSQGFIGPQFEHWMRNAALTLMDSPEGGTLIEIPKLFTDDGYRSKKIQTIQDPVVKAFWTQQLLKTADFHKSEMYNYFISKFGRFMTNITMRNIIGQPKSSFDFREVMDQKKILLINLAKGEIGEINSNLLGMIFVAKLFTAALSRSDIEESQRSDFYLYVDEFQNFATDTFASILSEARKFKLNLNITNQYIAQIPELIRDAIIGNVGTLIAFRIGVPDAEFMAKEFDPVADEKDLNNIDAFNAYVKLLVDNAPVRPFSMQTIKDETPKNEELGKAVLQLSKLKYGRDISVVEAEINSRIRLISDETTDETTQDVTRKAR